MVYCTGHHPKPQGLLDAYDPAKGEGRTFAVAHIHRWDGIAIVRRLETDMPLWNTIAVALQPEIALAQWIVFETPRKSWHFCGYSEIYREGRVSSAVVSFDPDRMTGITSSGRVYSLLNGPGTNGDADYVLGQWLAINHWTRDDIRFVDPSEFVPEPRH